VAREFPSPGEKPVISGRSGMLSVAAKVRGLMYGANGNYKSYICDREDNGEAFATLYDPNTLYPLFSLPRYCLDIVDPASLKTKLRTADIEEREE
jgi:hypothetical protein